MMPYFTLSHSSMTQAQLHGSHLAQKHAHYKSGLGGHGFNVYTIYTIKTEADTHCGHHIQKGQGHTTADPCQSYSIIFQMSISKRFPQECSPGVSLWICSQCQLPWSWLCLLEGFTWAPLTLWWFPTQKDDSKSRNSRSFWKSFIGSAFTRGNLPLIYLCLVNSVCQ